MENEQVEKIGRLLKILIGVGLLHVGLQGPIGETSVGEIVGMIAFFVGLSVILVGTISALASAFSSLLPKD